MLLKDLIENTKVTSIKGNLDKDIFGIAYDSRKVVNGDVFVAVPGTITDGTKFISTAIEFGASTIISERAFDTNGQATEIIVPSARAALADISNAFFDHPSRRLKIIGITGTNGKTTTTYLVESILKKAGFKTGIIGTIEMKIGDNVVPSNLTTPDSYDLQRFFSNCVREGVTHVVMEVSSHALSMKRVRGVEFDRAIYTNLSHDHLDFHKTLESYFDAKMNLFRMLGRGQKSDVSAIINADDQYSEAVIEEANGEIIKYSIDKSSGVTGKILEMSFNKMTAEIKLKTGTITISTPLIGKYNLYNILSAAAVCESLGVDLDAIRSGIEIVHNVSGRFEIIDEGQSFEVVVDFAHSPDSLEKVMQTANAVKKPDGRSILVFGSAGNRDKLKRPVMGKVAIKNSDITIITSDDPYNEIPEQIIKEIESGAQEAGGELEKNYFKITDRAQAIEKAISLARSNDIVVIAGRGHEKFQDINGKKIEIDDRVIARQCIKNLL